MNNINIDICIEILNLTANDKFNIFKNFLTMLLVSKYFNKKLSAYVFMLGSKLMFEYKSMSWLVPDTFEWINLEPKLEPLFKYVESNENMCIAGGYCGLIHMGKNLDDYPDSDVDIFIMKKTENSLDVLKYFLSFVKENYPGVTFCQRSGIFDIKICDVKRIIQIITSSFESPTHILSSFDFSYCKSCYYLGKTYSSPDAVCTKENNRTNYNESHIKLNRIFKAKKLGLTISNIKIDQNIIAPISPIVKHFSSVLEIKDIVLVSLNNFSQNYNSGDKITETKRIKLFKELNTIHLINLNTTLLDISKINFNYVTAKYSIKNPMNVKKEYSIIMINNNCQLIPFITIRGKGKLYNDGTVTCFETNDDDKINLLKNIYERVEKYTSTFPKYQNINPNMNNIKHKISYRIRMKNLNHKIIERLECDVKIVPYYIYYEPNGNSISHICGLYAYYHISDVTYCKKID